MRNESWFSIGDMCREGLSHLTIVFSVVLVLAVLTPRGLSESGDKDQKQSAENRQLHPLDATDVQIEKNVKTVNDIARVLSKASDHRVIPSDAIEANPLQLQPGIASFWDILAKTAISQNAGISLTPGTIYINRRTPPVRMYTVADPALVTANPQLRLQTRSGKQKPGVAVHVLWDHRRLADIKLDDVKVKGDDGWRTLNVRPNEGELGMLESLALLPEPSINIHRIKGTISGLRRVDWTCITIPVEKEKGEGKIPDGVPDIRINPFLEDGEKWLRCNVQFSPPVKQIKGFRSDQGHQRDGGFNQFVLIDVVPIIDGEPVSSASHKFHVPHVNNTSLKAIAEVKDQEDHEVEPGFVFVQEEKWSSKFRMSAQKNKEK